MSQAIKENGNWSFAEAKRAMTARSYLGGNLDWDAAEQLHQLLGGELPDDRSAAFRVCISRLVECVGPPWLQVLFSGRETASRSLNPDIIQCLQAAGAMERVPSPDAVRWLDELSMRGLTSVNHAKLQSGRIAERLSIAYEKKRTEEDGIKEDVDWISLNDNFAGYDIRSWVYGGGALRPKLIEVKGCSGNELSFFISRNEWLTAESAMSPFVFHVWELSSGTLSELSLEDVRPHMPNDNGGGEWMSVKVKIS